MTKADVFPRGSAVKEYGTPKSRGSTTLTAFGSPHTVFRAGGPSNVARKLRDALARGVRKHDP